MVRGITWPRGSSARNDSRAPGRLRPISVLRAQNDTAFFPGLPASGGALSYIKNASGFRNDSLPKTCRASWIPRTTPKSKPARSPAYSSTARVTCTIPTTAIFLACRHIHRALRAFRPLPLSKRRTTRRYTLILSLPKQGARRRSRPLHHHPTYTPHPHPILDLPTPNPADAVSQNVISGIRWILITSTSLMRRRRGRSTCRRKRRNDQNRSSPTSIPSRDNYNLSRCP